MDRKFGAIEVELSEDVESGRRVSPIASDHDGKYPLVAITSGKTAAWLGITDRAGKAGEIIQVYPPYSGLVMVKVECDETQVKTGWWVTTETDGYFSCHDSSGEVATGVIVSTIDEDPAPGKVVKAMVFTGRFVYDQKSP